jgi:3',5'-cyclic AMP phosphodiesterase CpdA
MRSISWLHISDIHMSARDSWAQDVVLKAMCDHIAWQREEGIIADFILATGDLAFSGKTAEYALIDKFFKHLEPANRGPVACISGGKHSILRV